MSQADDSPDYDPSNAELVAFEAGFRRGARAELSFHLCDIETQYGDIPENLRPMVRAALEVIGMGNMLPGENNMEEGYSACGGDEWGPHYAAWLAERAVKP